MKNVILLVCDALRYDHVTPELMPNLCKYSKISAVFTHCFAIGGATRQSMPAIFSGAKKYDPEDNIATILLKNKITTGMVHSNPLLKEFSYGFEERETTYEEDWKLRLKSIMKKMGIWRQTRNIRRRAAPEKVHTMPYRRAEVLLKESQMWINKTKSPWFFWTQLMDSHIPYLPPDYDKITLQEMRMLNDKILDSLYKEATITEDEKETIKDLYKAEIKYMDKELGKFLFNITKNYPDTLVVVTSDHGDEFGEYGFYSHAPGKHGLIPQLNHIPLIFSHLDIPPMVYDEYVSHLDIGPTILNFFGVDEKIGYGNNLLPILKKQRKTIHGDE